MKTLIITKYLGASLIVLILFNGIISAQEIEKKFPEIKGYTGIVHPLITFNSKEVVPNFRDYYIVGNPWGINIWKSKKVGISFEFTPFIKSDNKGTIVSNFLFHPGILYRLGKDYILIGRVAYETSGRYGITPILTKVYKRYENHNFFAAILLPVRFGNYHNASATLAFQFGIGF